MIPQGKIEAAARAINPRAFMEPMNNQLRNDQRRALVDANKALEAAAAWDREHATELVTDAMTRAQLDFLQYRRDLPLTFPDWGRMGGSGGARERMAWRLERAGYLIAFPEDSERGWQITEKGRAALREAGR